MDTAKTLSWKIILFIALVSIVNFHFFTEGSYSGHISPLSKGVGHLVSLLIIWAAGCRVWRKNDNRLLGMAWTYAYLLIGVVIITAGIAHYYFYLASYASMQLIGTLRAYFTTPVPYFILHLLQKILPE